jgi:hypothetical protein
MVLIPVRWTEYTATMQGRAIKSVTCENCATEYVYTMERQATGTGTSVYGLNPGAPAHARAAAGDTLHAYLDNDFDPVPCPACGHYQRYMFPKLMETTSLLGLLVTVSALVFGAVSAVAALKCSLTYARVQSDATFSAMLTAWSALLAAGMVASALYLVRSVRVRRFDPNRTDQQSRIALGRSRALTREDYEKLELVKVKRSKMPWADPGAAPDRGNGN